MLCKQTIFVMLILAFTVLIPISLFANMRYVEVSPTAEAVKLRNNSQYGFNVSFDIQRLGVQEVSTKAGVFDQVSIYDYTYTNAVGDPQLPMLRKIITAPLGADVQFKVLSREEKELTASNSGLKHRIIPAQAPVSKSADYATLPFIVNEESYARNGFDQKNAIMITELGIMRGVRLLALDFYPVSYNPVQNALKVIHSMDISVEFVNPDFAATEELLAKTASNEFNQLYQKTIFNWDSSTRQSLVRNPTKMLILCPPAYVDSMAVYIEWKKQQGFNVILRTVGSSGQTANTSAAIISYMQSVWSAATANDPAPTYLLIVGDHSSTGNNITANTGQTNTGHITDLTYVRLEGSDYVPEMYYGRFSVSSLTELSRVMRKTIMFEKTAMPDLSYLSKVVLIAGVDASWAPTHGNGALNYGTTHYFNASNGITSNTYLYPESGSSSSQIIANASEGRGYMNYTAHGSTTSWADPSFTVTNMQNLTNVNKPFVAVGNCCVTNQFTTGECFGESVIRSQNAGVAYIGATNNTT